MELALHQVALVNRFRQDHGDIPALMASITDVGLLHPILVTPEYRLIDGARRLDAYQRLGRTSIEVRVLSVPSLLRAEHDANELAKQFTVSERVAIGLAIEAEIGRRQGQRTDKLVPNLAQVETGNNTDQLRQNFAEVPRGMRTDVIAADRAGFGNKETYRQAKHLVSHGTPALIQAVDTGHVAVSTAAEVATLPHHEQTEIVARGEKEILATAQRIRAERSHRSKFTGESEWYTPAEYVALARTVLGTIDLDPASSELAQDTIQATRYFTEDENGLTQEWPGRVWLNPPFSQPLIVHFIDKLLAELDAGHTTHAILLTHNYTDTAWFHSAAHAAHAICFTRGRIGFVSALGGIAAPMQGQAFFYFGPDIDLFATTFHNVGFVTEVRS